MKSPRTLAVFLLFGLASTWAPAARADAIPACLSLRVNLHFQSGLWEDREVYRGRLGRARIDTKTLLERLRPLFPSTPFPERSCIEVSPSGTVMVRNARESFEQDVSQYLAFEFDHSHEIITRARDRDTGAGRGTALFPLEMSIDLPGLQVVLTGLASSVMTAGPVDDGLQKRSVFLRARLLGKGAYQLAGSAAPSPVLVEGSLALSGRSVLPD